MVTFVKLRGLFALRRHTVLTAILAAGLVITAGIPVQAESLTYELSARVVPLPNAQFPNGQPQGATITGRFTFDVEEFLHANWNTPPDVVSTLQYNPADGGTSVPLLMTEFSSRFECTSTGGCIPTMMLVEPGVGFAYLEFVEENLPSGLPLQTTWNLHGLNGDNETEEFQMGGTSGYGEVRGSATLVTPEPPGILLVGASCLVLLVTKFLRQ